MKKTTTINTHRLKAAFVQAVTKARYEVWTPGIMGVPDGAGGYLYDAPGGAGWKWVRIVDNSDNVVAISRALNTAGVSDDGTQHIWLEPDIEGNLSIVLERNRGW